MAQVCSVGDFLLMARRFNSRYFIDLGDGQIFKVSASEWREAVAGGWIEPNEAPGHVARLCVGVVARVKSGLLWLRDSLRECFIRTSWAAIDAISPVRGEHYRKEIEDSYGDLRFEKLTWVKTGMIGWTA